MSGARTKSQQKPKSKQNIMIASHCTNNHRTKYAACVQGVVHKLPLSCRKSDIGQTGRCINDRVREHKASTKNVPSGHWAMHLRDFPKCEVDCHGVITMHKNNDRLARKIIEAMEIEEGVDDCVSTVSVALTDKEKLLRTIAPGPRG